MRGFPICLSLWVSLVFSASAQDSLHLKNMLVREGGERAEGLQQLPPVLSRSGDRVHVLAQFVGALSPEQLGELDARGIRVVQYVPDSGYVFSVNQGFRLADAGLRRVIRLLPRAKISTALGQEAGIGSEGYLVAEFFPDVRSADRPSDCGRAGVRGVAAP